MVSLDKQEKKLLKLLKLKRAHLDYYRDSRNVGIYQTLVVYRECGSSLSIIAHGSIKANYLSEAESKQLVLKKLLYDYGNYRNKRVSN
jgi:hypothetical protein|nr:MAG TPA: hypothetical protein [Crassvirales sp.]